MEGHVEVVRTLINAGALITAIDRWGHTPLDEALSFGHEDIVNALDPTGEAYNLLVIDRERMASDESRHPVTSLIRPASDGASHPSFLQTAECSGAATEHSTLLLPNSLSTSIQSADYAALDSTAIRPTSDRESTLGGEGAAELCDAAGSSNLREVNRLLTKGADVNGKDYDHRTVLHIAACTGDLAVLERILAVPSINVNCVDRWHTTPLKDALSNDFLDGAQLLKAHGAISIDDHVGPQLCAAASKGNLQALLKFKLQGVDLSTGDCASVPECPSLPPRIRTSHHTLLPTTLLAVHVIRRFANGTLPRRIRGAGKHCAVASRPRHLAGVHRSVRLYSARRRTARGAHRSHRNPRGALTGYEHFQFGDERRTIVINFCSPRALGLHDCTQRCIRMRKQRSTTLLFYFAA